MSQGKNRSIQALLRKYSKLLSQMHGELQRMRFKVQPEEPMQKWSTESMRHKWTVEPNQVAEQLLEAEFHCLEAGEEIRDLLRSKSFKALL
jgi:hypothetical protein